jgi:hypothetical protein
MLLDRTLRMSFRNFSTLFLLVATVTVPLHLAHAVAFRSVLALRELHPAIEAFPKSKQIRGVGRADLAAARRAGLAVTVAELALVPFLVGAAGRALAHDARGEVPTVTGSWAGLGDVREMWRAITSQPAAAAAVAAVALLVWWTARAAGLVTTEVAPDSVAFAGVGLLEGLARALGGFLLVGGLAGLARSPKASEVT